MTLSRGLEILKLLAEAGPMSVGEICGRAGLHRVTAHRLLASLMRQGWVEQDKSRHYQLGIEAWRIGVSANERFDLVKIGDPALDRIEQEMGDTTFLLKRNGDDAICVARREGTYPLKFLVMNVGVSYPLGVGAGTLAILAQLEEEERERILSVTQSKLARFPRISIDLVREMTAETRERGFALSTGRIVPGAYSAAVPIFADGRPVGSFACAASAERLSGDRLEFVVQTMWREAELVGQQLSGKAASAQARDASRAQRRTNHDRAT